MAIEKVADGASLAPADGDKPKEPKAPHNKKGLQIFGCAGFLFLIGLGLCCVILPLRMARVWKDAEKFKEIKPPPSASRADPSSKNEQASQPEGDEVGTRPTTLIDVWDKELGPEESNCRWKEMMEKRRKK